ncbi:MAG TPA: AIPR family protein [Phycisphaerales bacterium]|nr:AIPR family protein [Phycisphaerales bacterium]
MPITSKDKQEIEQLYSDFKSKWGGCKEDYFACLYLSRKFERPIEDIRPFVAFGNNDYGIDAYFIERASKNLYLFQFKWSENHALFRESLERLAKDGIERIFGNAKADPHKNELLAGLRAELADSRDLIKRVLVHMVFKGDLDAAENSQGLQARREDVENKHYIVEDFFKGDDGVKRDIEFRVEFIADTRRPPLPPPPQSFRIRLSEAASITTPDGEHTMHVGFVPLMDLHAIYLALNQRFLDRNIRSGLSEDNPPNKKIRQALSEIVLERKVEPEVFAFNHNGVTLAVEQFVQKEGVCEVKVPRLLNGAQTITSVARFMKEHEKHPSMSGPDSPLSRVKVLAKVVVADPASDFVTTVTISNNRQNPVNSWNLRANDRVQSDLHDLFKEKLELFYSRQENSFAGYSDEELEKAGYDTTRDLRIRPMAQTLLAIQGEIPKMSQLPEVFENQKWYTETFRESYVDSDPRRIVIAYKTGLMLRAAMDELDERAAGKHRPAIAKARNLVWSLLVQAIYNSNKLLEYLDLFGTRMTKEVAFKELLVVLARREVLPLLKTILDDKMYAPKLADEKYEFLRTKEVFTKCMADANKKFDWVKKPL